ncbi:MAG: hypothetical protein ABF868_07400 [Sporolactobacillus sp.]
MWRVVMIGNAGEDSGWTSMPCADIHRLFSAFRVFTGATGDASRCRRKRETEQDG